MIGVVSPRYIAVSSVTGMTSSLNLPWIAPSTVIEVWTRVG